MVRCVDCRKLSVYQVKMRMLVKTKDRLGMKTYYAVPKQAKASPIGDLASLKCEVRGVLRHNWNIYKDRKCEDFEVRKT